MRKKLADATYDQEINRMDHLRGFPHLPRGQQDLRRALRRVTEYDGSFLHRVVSEFVDAGQTCPTPRELSNKANELRRNSITGGKPGCPECHGTGWITATKRIVVPGFPPYDADYSKRCACVEAAQPAGQLP